MEHKSPRNLPYFRMSTFFLALMQQYSLAFGFREPYQILVAPSIVLDAACLKIDLVAALNRTIRGTVKPMITQCSIRQLYTTNDQSVIESAKRLERKRCGHHDLELPLSTLECLKSCVDPKGTGVNSLRYIVVAQEPEIRAKMRNIPGVPLIYITRSIVLLEPMSGLSMDTRGRAKKEKFREGIRGTRKRKRDTQEDTLVGEEVSGRAREDQEEPQVQKKRKRAKGPKGPSPLSVKKPKKMGNQQFA